MRVLKITEEYRVEDEFEAKQAMESFREAASEKGYTIGAMGYTHKEKKSKGDIIDACEILKVTKIYGGPWDNE